MFVNTYLYDTPRELLYIGNKITCCSKENKPMDTSLIKIHKGVDNTVEFVVKDKDRKSVSVDTMTVGAKFVSLETKEVMLEKYLSMGSCKGQMCLTVYEGDLRDIPAGFYHLVLTQEKMLFGSTERSAVHLPFYTDTGDNIVYSVELTDQGHVTPMPSLVLDPSTWVPLNAQSEPYIYYSGPIAANTIRNHKNSIHTFMLSASEFTGTLEVLGSLDANPPTDILQYFSIDLAPSVHEINMDAYTGTTAFTIQANLSWVNFKLTYDATLGKDDNGVLEKIVWRS